jgi:starch synthase (maltosyl-transferring)
MAAKIDDRRKIVIEDVHPELDCGRYAVKREVGDTVTVWADIFKEGHDASAAAVRYRPEDEDEWRETRMRFHDNDRWTGSFVVDRNLRWYFTVVAWTDAFGTWVSDLRKKYEAGQEVELELAEGASMIRGAADRADKVEAGVLRRILAEIEDEDETLADRVAAALDPQLLALVERWPDRGDLTEHERVLPVQVDRVAARFAAWYELFPRSASDDPDRHGTFDDVIAKLPYVRDMGFDVLYFPPIHPIGLTFRKGKNNTLGAGPDQPGSPYAIGGEAGGHREVHPELGTLADFRRLVEAAHEQGLEIALDFAIQVSPDHPYVEAHPSWFFVRPDGPSSTPRTRRRSTRTSTRSTSTATTGRRSGRSGATWCSTGSSRG